MPLRPPAGFISAFYDPLNNPNAPTIGTATGGIGGASVTFTAPSNVGGSAITSYTVISSPGGFIGTGTSSPVTVSGLSATTSYTFRVFATNSFGPSAYSAVSNSITTPPALGSVYGGGYFAGQINQGGTIYNLVVSPIASGETTAIQWKTSNDATSGTDSDIDGPSNSAAMNNSSHPAAQFCEGRTIGGFSDWYMPARMELEVCYFFLKPSTTSNNTSYGANAYAVFPEPINTNYTSGSPAQTSVAIFQVGGGEDFSNSGTQAGDYWASTQSTTQTNRGWWERFRDGVTSTDSKTSLLRVRAIRRVAA